MSYISLLRNNRNIRLLWLGQIVSQLGDWFNAVAVYVLLLELIGSATAVAWMMITQFLPMALVGPMAGVVVDRVDRRRVMIVADVVRGLLILGLLIVRRADQVWIAYLVMASTVVATAFFEPARTATIPNMTTADELVPANALAAATWSAMLAIGAAVGGLVTAVAGRNTAFAINSASFFVSAVVIAQTRYKSRPPASERPPGLAALTGATDFVEGFRYVRARRHVAALMLVKAGWGIAGGVLLLLTVFGQRVFPIASGAAGGIAVLYGARGVGAALGPIFIRATVGHHPRALRQTIGPAYFMVALFYIALASAPNIALAALCVLAAHFGGSILWVFSTVLLQMEVPDRFRGRVFAAELALVTLSSSASSFLTARALDQLRWSPRVVSWVLGVAFCVPGLAWLVIQRRWHDLMPLRPVAVEAVPEDEMLEGRIG